MRKVLLTLFLSLIFYNTTRVESSLLTCQGSNFQQWTNCKGTLMLSNKDKYVGEFKKGKYDGQGIYTYWFGDKYIGEYIDGKRHGQGTYTFDDGDKYVGEWKKGKRHGQGTYTFSNGVRWVGEWKDDELNY